MCSVVESRRDKFNNVTRKASLTFDLLIIRRNTHVIHARDAIGTHICVMHRHGST